MACPRRRSSSLRSESIILAAQPAAQRVIYRAVLAHLKSVGRVDIGPVQVGIMVKRARTFCELRPKRDWVELGFKLSRE